MTEQDWEEQLRSAAQEYENERLAFQSNRGRLDQIFDRVENLAADKTLIIISHRFSTVRNADRIFVIDKGKITEEGTHDQLMKQNGVYASLFNLQAKRYK